MATDNGNLKGVVIHGANRSEYGPLSENAAEELLHSLAVTHAHDV